MPDNNRFMHNAIPGPGHGLCGDGRRSIFRQNLLRLRTLSSSFLGGGPGHGKLPRPAHQKALKKYLSESKNQSCPMVPQGGVVPDMTHSADELNRMPGNAVGNSHTRRHPSVLLEHKKT